MFPEAEAVRDQDDNVAEETRDEADNVDAEEILQNQDEMVVFDFEDDPGLVDAKEEWQATRSGRPVCASTQTKLLDPLVGEKQGPSFIQAERAKQTASTKLPQKKYNNFMATKRESTIRSADEDVNDENANNEKDVRHLAIVVTINLLAINLFEVSGRYLQEHHYDANLLLEDGF